MPLTLDEVSLLLTLVAQPKHQPWDGPSKRHTWAQVLTKDFPMKKHLLLVFISWGVQEVWRKKVPKQAWMILFPTIYFQLVKWTIWYYLQALGFLLTTLKDALGDAIRHAGAGCVTSAALCVLKTLRHGILRTAEKPKCSIGITMVWNGWWF